MRTLFNGSHRFTLVGDLNAGDADWGTILCNAFPFSFDTESADLIQYSLMFQHSRESPCPRSDAYTVTPQLHAYEGCLGRI